LQNTLGQTLPFHAKDIHSKTYPPHFKLQMVPSHIVGLLNYQLKNTLIELYARIYITRYGTISGVDGIKKNIHKTFQD